MQTITVQQITSQATSRPASYAGLTITPGTYNVKETTNYTLSIPLTTSWFDTYASVTRAGNLNTILEKFIPTGWTLYSGVQAVYHAHNLLTCDLKVNNVSKGSVTGTLPRTPQVTYTTPSAGVANTTSCTPDSTQVVLGISVNGTCKVHITGDIVIYRDRLNSTPEYQHIQADWYPDEVFNFTTLAADKMFKLSVTNQKVITYSRTCTLTYNIDDVPFYENIYSTSCSEVYTISTKYSAGVSSTATKKVNYNTTASLVGSNMVWYPHKPDDEKIGDTLVTSPTKHLPACMAPLSVSGSTLKAAANCAALQGILYNYTLDKVTNGTATNLETVTGAPSVLTDILKTITVSDTSHDKYIITIQQLYNDIVVQTFTDSVWVGNSQDTLTFNNISGCLGESGLADCIEMPTLDLIDQELLRGFTPVMQGCVKLVGASGAPVMALDILIMGRSAPYKDQSDWWNTNLFKLTWIAYIHSSCSRIDAMTVQLQEWHTGWRNETNPEYNYEKAVGWNLTMSDPFLLALPNYTEVNSAYPYGINSRMYAPALWYGIGNSDSYYAYHAEASEYRLSISNGGKTWVIPESALDEDFTKCGIVYPN